MKRLLVLFALTGLAACSKEPTTVRVEAATVAEAPDDPLPRGAMAPDFEAMAHDGTKVALASLRGKPVVLYFYPKDDTPG